ncbi:MAG: beta-lactamase family protein [Saccharospirillum sp.]|nr:beta-lactamase family protein [Saccharospirillum sp.]
MTRPLLLGFMLVALTPLIQAQSFDNLVQQAERFGNLRTLIIAHQGEVVLERAFNGSSLSQPANIKSASKSLISALVGIAIEKDLIEHESDSISRYLSNDFPANPDARLNDITISHLLSMQAGLQRTSGQNYGGWVASRNWVQNALARPFVTDPGGAMQYSTGSTHLLSAILTQEGGRTTAQLANEWLAPANIRISHWLPDPQGIPLGGNQVSMTPYSLLALGELYRRGGLSAEGERILSQEWIDKSWTPRTNSRFTGDGYGYGWFIRPFNGYQGYYGWGYGGQMIYVIPDLELTIAITSDENLPAGRSGYRNQLHRLIAQEVVPVIAALN